MRTNETTTTSKRKKRCTASSYLFFLLLFSLTVRGSWGENRYLLTLLRDAVHTVIDCLFFSSRFHLCTAYHLPLSRTVLFPSSGFSALVQWCSSPTKFSYWPTVYYFDSAETNRHSTPLAGTERERKGEKESATNNRGEAWSSCTLDKASISTDLYTHTHMRMGFRPLVNMSAPLSANISSMLSSTTARSFVNPFLNQSSYTGDNNHHHLHHHHPHHQQQQQQQQLSQPQDNDESEDVDLRVELENKPLWDAFHGHGTEMVENFLGITIFSTPCPLSLV